MLLREITPDLLPPQVAMLCPSVILVAMPPGMTDTMLAERVKLTPPWGTVAVTDGRAEFRIAALHAPPGSAPMLMTSDAAEMAGELDAPSRRRLLGFVLGFCRTAFGLGDNAAFAACCVRMAVQCEGEPAEARVVARAGTAFLVVAGVEISEGSVAYVLGARRVALSGAPRLAMFGHELTCPAEHGDLVLVLGEAAALWRLVVDAGAAVPDVLRLGSEEPALRGACLQAMAGAGGGLMAIAREIQVLAPAAAVRQDDPARPLGAVLEVALPDGEGGMFLRGWLRDPMRLVAEAALWTPMGSVAIDPGRLHRVRRADVAGRYGQAAFRDAEGCPGFMAHVADPSDGRCPQPTLALRLNSGAVVEVTPALRHVPAGAARDAVLGCVPPEEATPWMMDDCLAPAAGALHRQALQGRGAVEVVRIGWRPVARRVWESWCRYTKTSTSFGSRRRHSRPMRSAGGRTSSMCWTARSSGRGRACAAGAACAVSASGDAGGDAGQPWVCGGEQCGGGGCVGAFVAAAELGRGAGAAGLVGGHAGGVGDTGDRGGWAEVAVRRRVDPACGAVLRAGRRGRLVQRALS